MRAVQCTHVRHYADQAFTQICPITQPVARAGLCKAPAARLGAAMLNLAYSGRLLLMPCAELAMQWL